MTDLNILDLPHNLRQRRRRSVNIETRDVADLALELAGEDGLSYGDADRSTQRSEETKGGCASSHVAERHGSLQTDEWDLEKASNTKSSYQRVENFLGPMQ